MPDVDAMQPKNWSKQQINVEKGLTVICYM